MPRLVASRKQQKEAMRAERERRDREAAAVERRRRVRGYAIAAALAASAVAAIVVAFTAGGGGGGGSTEGLASYYPKERIPPAPARLDVATAAKAAGCSFQTHPGEGHDHTTESVTYKTNPPSSGNHNPLP